MTELEKAARQMLEALEAHVGSYHPLRRNAIAAGRRALEQQPAALDWSNAGRLIEAAGRANAAGHLTGTSNWAAAVCKYMLSAPEQKGN